MSVLVYPRTGHVEETLSSGGGETIVAVNWTADASGDCVDWLSPIGGTLRRMTYRATVAGTGGTHSVYLYDEYGIDMLDGRGAGLTDSATDTVFVYRAVEADLDVPIVLCGPLQLRVSGADASDAGYMAFFVRP